MKQDNHLTPIGSTIKESRKYNNFTQKELGIKLGFVPDTSDIRIAQYESEQRFASKKYTERMSEILGINKYAISKLSVNSELEALHTLLKIDACYGFEWNKKDDVISFSIPKHFKTLNENLNKVYAAKQLYTNGSISYDDYIFIKNSCGITDDYTK